MATTTEIIAIAAYAGRLARFDRADIEAAIGEIESRMTVRLFTSRYGHSRMGGDLGSLSDEDRCALHNLRIEARTSDSMRARTRKLYP